VAPRNQVGWLSYGRARQLRAASIAHADRAGLGRQITERDFRPGTDEAKTAYLDGELCDVGDEGVPSFSQTQAASDGERGVRLVYYAFDLLHLDG
jgi:ATP-dependent DNA ligase